MEEAGYNIIPESELEYSRLIGSRESSNSTVYTAVWTREGAKRMVAAKSCNNFREEEVKILAKVQHKNVIKFLGLVKLRIPPDGFVIVTELAEKGSLWRMIAENRGNWQEYRQPVWLKWAKEGAKALRYIHHKKFQHGDVKSPNFVITGDDILKICDLGTAREYSDTVSTDTVRGSYPWMAPEAMGVSERQEVDGQTRKACKVTAKADVFSFAVVLWELITGKVPHEEKRGQFEIYQAVFKRKEHLEIPTECLDSLAELMARCWDADHRQRPKMKEVHQFLVEFDATDATTPTSLSKTTAASHHSALANISNRMRRQITPAIKSMKKREILGMLEYRQEDNVKIIKTIIIDFHPKNAESHLPGLPAYIIFMCIRHADDINDERKVKALLQGVINGIQETVKNHLEDFEYVSFWLTNTIRLMHTLKQYSGEDTFSSQNTHRQNKHCLRNFDLSEYHQVMNDLGVHIYQRLVYIIKNKLRPMIFPAMLECDFASFLIPCVNITIKSLIKQLTTFLTVMNNHGMDPEVVRQAINQSFYLVTASTINNILLRKDMCHWSKGVQIRYNMSELEEWLRNSRLYDHNMEETLEPLVQIAQLLQFGKRTEDDVRHICETCTKLTTTQVVKILNLFTPNDYAKKIEVSFIRKVQDKLAGRMDTKKDAQLLIDPDYTFPVTFPFNPSSVLLNEITIPDTFKLDCVKRV